MREFVFGTILVGAAAAGVYFMPIGSFGGGEPQYKLSVGEAKALLAKADLRAGKEPFGRLDVLVTSPQANEVRYEAGGTFAAIDCSAKLTDVGEGVTVATSCKRAAVADGAAASTGKDITEIAFAEYVASVLGKRPFDEVKVRNASAGAVMKNLGSMQRDALKMQRDVQQGISEMDEDTATMDDGAYDSGGSDEGSTADYAPGSE